MFPTEDLINKLEYLQIDTQDIDVSEPSALNELKTNLIETHEALLRYLKFKTQPFMDGMSKKGSVEIKVDEKS